MNNNLVTILGAVVIGRNEGERLRKCLLSLIGYGINVVYVDSASTDDSIKFATSIGVKTVQLDMSKPFTAARARNEGFDSLMEMAGDLEFVQFIDGDCEIVDGWFNKAIAILRQHDNAAVVCGRRRERFPDASVFNMFCDIEWNTPIGEVDACGGDALMRVDQFKAMGGYNPTLIAGEEPELCVRFRLAGFKILRIDAEMTLHDANMHHIRQWWKRAVRTGHAFAEGNALHGHTSLRHYVRPVRSIFIWGLFLPIVIVISLIAALWSTMTLFIALFGAAGYGKIISKSYVEGRNRGGSARDALLYGFSIAVAKIPQLIGAFKYYTNRWRGKKTALIEYKMPGEAKTRS